MSQQHVLCFQKLTDKTDMTFYCLSDDNLLKVTWKTFYSVVVCAIENYIWARVKEPRRTALSFKLNLTDYSWELSSLICRISCMEGKNKSSLPATRVTIPPSNFNWSGDVARSVNVHTRLTTSTGVGRFIVLLSNLYSNLGEWLQMWCM